MITLPIKQSMLKRLVGTVAIAATAFGLATTAAAPAYADRSSDRLAAFIAGLAVIGIIANSANAHRPAPAPVTPQPQPLPQHHYPPTYPPVTPYYPPVVQAPLLPAHCALRFQGADHGRVSYGERCLVESGFRYRLPQYCAQNVVIYGRHDRIFPARCLQDAGFSTGRR